MVKQTFSNTFSNILLTLSKFILGILLVPVLIGELGKESYGFIVILLSILGISDFFDIGIRQSLSKSIASVKGNNKNEIEKYFSNALIAYHFIFIIAATVVVMVFYGFGNFFNLGKLPKDLTEIEIILFLIFYIYFGLIQSAYSGIIVSANRFDLNNYRSAFFSITSIIFIIISIEVFHLGIRGWVYTTIIFKFLELLALMKLKERLYPGVKLVLALFNYKSMKELISFGGIIFMATWNKKIKFDSDPFLITHFMSPAALVLYRPGTSLAQNVRPIISSFAGQMYVSATQASVNSDEDRLKKIFITGSKYTALLSIPFLLFFGFEGRDILTLWLGKVLNSQELETCYYVLLGWCFIDFFFYIEGSSFSVLFGIGKLKHMIYLDFLIAVTNICAGIAIFYFFNLGVLSVIIPGVVIELFARLYFLFYTGSQINVSKMVIFNKILLKILWILMITVPLSFLLVYITPSNIILRLLYIGIGISLFWIVSVFAFGLEDTEKKYFLNIFQRKFKWLF